MKRVVKIVVLMGLGILSACKVDESDTLPADQVFIKFYGGIGIERAADFLVRADGGFVLFGTTTSGSSDQSENFYVVFTDAYGNQEGSSIVIDRVVLDETNTKIPTRETASRIRKVSDGYILIGSSSYQVPNESFTQSDIFVAHVADNDSIKTFTIGEVYDSNDGLRPSDEFGADIVEIENGYILAGSTNDTRITGSVASGADVYVAKLNRELTDVTRTADIPSALGDESALAMELNGSNVFIVGTTITGTSTSGGDDNTNVFYLESDTANLGSQGGSPFGGPKNDVPSRIRSNSAGDYYLTGNSTDINTGAQTAFVMRIVSGNLIDYFEISLEGRAERILANDILRLPGSDYLIAGERLATSDLRGSEMMLGRVTPGGELVESFGASEGLQYFGGAANDQAVAVERLSDGSIVFLGTVDLDANGNTYMCLVKTNSRGVLGE